MAVYEVQYGWRAIWRGVWLELPAMSLVVKQSETNDLATVEVGNRRIFTLEDEAVEFVKRDSPGVLLPFEEKKTDDPQIRQLDEPPQDRQLKAAPRTRGRRKANLNE